jgi:hypothetical protein
MKPGEGNGKIFVGVPRERLYIPSFIDNLIAILGAINDAGKNCGLYQAEGHRVDRNRDDIVRSFMAHPDKPEWLLMLDSDMAHPVDIGPRLASWNKDIVGGLYFHRGGVHDPLAFMEADPKADAYGRSTRMWEPMRDEVYDFLIRERVPLIDSAISVEKTLRDPLVECDALGTGAMIIHRSVLEEMQPPWFEYEAGGNSEDLVFCYNAKRAGFKVFCDLARISGHYIFVPIGQAQFRVQFEARGVVKSSYTPAEAIDMVADFFKMERDEAKALMTSGSAHYFGDYFSKTYGDFEKIDAPTMREVYKDKNSGLPYIVELLYWNASPQYSQWRNSSMVKSVRGQNVMDFGSGIGTLALQLAIQGNKTYAIEINEVLRKFTDFRHKRILNDLATKTGELFVLPTIDPSTMPLIDTVFAMDVFEHLDAELLEWVITKIGAVTRRGGHLIYHANYGQQDIYPMHYYEGLGIYRLYAVLEAAGFTVVDEHNAYRR